MSDFPYHGDVKKTRAWLDKNGFKNCLKKWNADSLIGVSKDDLMTILVGEEGMRLCGLLNTARALSSLSFQGNHKYPHLSHCGNLSYHYI